MGLQVLNAPLKNENEGTFLLAVYYRRKEQKQHFGLKEMPVFKRRGEI